MTEQTEPIAILSVSPARRWFAALVQGLLGLVLVAAGVGFAGASPVATALLILAGGLAAWQGWRLFQATARSIVLTREGLFDSAAEPIAPLDAIRSVDRGAFAFKPSNGFSVRLDRSLPAAWVPGLWWRLGTRVGVGGTTSGKAARDMADVISILLAERRGEISRED